MENDNTSPSDAELEAHFSNYDPLNSPSPVQVVGNVRLPEPSLSGLPPSVRAEIEAKLVGVSPAKRVQEEQRLIAEALRFNSR